ncbi:MurR/RpiR family transcriptional regulator [Pandoraea oxalativorans]|uniref:Transcriptional regulator n=1 Tax=Pandoraea oxalativorans TaxID=573737 RepID=A0A0E3U6H8_9BURK|nr:MurR/RpiR family transcriptional regulator [Pandoraea oxalativorans]AKC69538.1 transcriptional regulator [Pandoraea oxalativorans]
MAETFDIVTRVAERSDALSQAERKVAQVVLEDVAGAAAASINVLAERAGVSEASVTRFAKAMGCRDVRDLKLRLAQAAVVGQRFLGASAANGQDGGETIDRIADDIQTTLQVHRGLIKPDTVRRAAARLLSARMVYAFGMGGGSSLLADEARYRLVRLGRPVASYQDAVLARMVAGTLGRDDVVLAFSVSGHTPELLSACEIAREYGAQVVAVTATGSPLSALADEVLPIRALETDFIFKPSSSRYAMLLAMDVLATELALLAKPQSQALLRRIKYVLDTHRGGGDRQPLGD